MDLEADAIIRALFVRNPEAAYRITKLAMTLESELEALRAATGSGGERRLPGRVGDCQIGIEAEKAIAHHRHAGDCNPTDHHVVRENILIGIGIRRLNEG